MPGRDLNAICGRVLARVADTPAGALILQSAGVAAGGAEPYRDFLRLPVLDRARLADLQRQYPDRAGFSTIPLAEFGRLGLHPGGELDISYAGRNGVRIMAGLFGRFGIGKDDIVVNTFGYHMSTVAHVFDGALRELGACVVPAGPGNAGTQAQLIERVGATAWLGFPSFLWRMLTEGSEQPGLATLRLAVLGGEFAPTVRRELLARFGIASREFYGVSILGPAAYECEAGEGMHVLDEMLVEIVDRGTGQPVEPGAAGELVLTPLDNEYVIPRLGTGDLSRWLTRPCPCGLAGDRIEGVLGRVGEAVKARGVFIYPRDVRLVREALPGVRHCTLVVSRSAEPSARDELVLHVTTEAGAEPAPDLAERAAQAFADACRMRLDRVEISDEVIDERVLVDTRQWEVSAQ